MPRLGVNIDHVASVRQARGTSYPDPLLAAVTVERAGADQITVHLREDRRHIQDHDLTLLRKTIQSELNLEMAATEEMIGIARTVKPNCVTLVPEKRAELTTEGGLDIKKNRKVLAKAVQELKAAGIRVSLFIDPEEEAVRLSAEFGADAIEIHTGRYAEISSPSSSNYRAVCLQPPAEVCRLAPQWGEELNRIAQAARLGKSLRLFVAAGHGLNYQNTKAVTHIQEIEEYNIGHAIVARAIFVGLEQAVREMKELIC